MENKMCYHFDGKWEEDLEELICRLVEEEELDKETIVGLKIDLCNLETVVDLDFDRLSEIISDVYEDRMDEERDVMERIEKTLKKHIDFEGLNKELEAIKMYYPDKEYTITEEDWNNVKF